MNSAVDTESCSELPLLITKLLKDLGVSYQIQRDRPNIPAAQRVQAVLLDDSIGAMLVLFPQDHLLDLARLAELTGRELAAVKPAAALSSSVAGRPGSVAETASHEEDGTAPSPGLSGRGVRGQV